MQDEDLNHCTIAPGLHINIFKNLKHFRFLGLFRTNVNKLKKTVKKWCCVVACYMTTCNTRYVPGAPFLIQLSSKCLEQIQKIEQCWGPTHPWSRPRWSSWFHPPYVVLWWVNQQMRDLSLTLIFKGNKWNSLKWKQRKEPFLLVFNELSNICWQYLMYLIKGISRWRGFPNTSIEKITWSKAFLWREHTL